jgi:hypothetical protein
MTPDLSARSSVRKPSRWSDHLLKLADTRQILVLRPKTEQWRRASHAVAYGNQESGIAQIRAGLSQGAVPASPRHDGSIQIVYVHDITQLR